MPRRHKQWFSHLKSSIGSEVIAPNHSPWDSTYFIMALYQRTIVHCICCMVSLSLQPTKSHVSLCVYCKYTLFSDFCTSQTWEDFSELLFEINDYPTSLSFHIPWSDQVCESSDVRDLPEATPLYSFLEEFSVASIILFPYNMLFSVFILTGLHFLLYFYVDCVIKLSDLSQ